MQGLLDELGIACYPKTSGNRGLHMYARSSPAGTPVEVRARGGGPGPRARAPATRPVTASWWKEERGRRSLSTSTRTPLTRPSSEPGRHAFAATARFRRHFHGTRPRRRTRRADNRDCAGPVPPPGRPLGGHAGQPTVARTAAAAGCTRPRSRSSRRALAAAVPETAR